MNMVDKIIAYENGEMSYEEEMEFFQDLINTGLCWKLQGFYGRTAQALIATGQCKRG